MVRNKTRNGNAKRVIWKTKTREPKNLRYQIVSCSSVVIKNGRGGPTISPPLYFIDSIDISLLCEQGINKRASEIYASGGSLREVEAQLQISKTKVRKSLIESGVAMRPKTHGQNGRANGTPPYGYFADGGQLVKDSKEQKIVRRILDYWKSGKGFREIARMLNNQKIKPRSGKVWDHSVIKSIINKHKKMNIEKELL